ncbi:family 78 glycoside hydrolase catalytic domain [Bacillus mobilis]|uniref:family 78 glycoside hydrolase catalytic domain n=1 Tax=Bacillus mobilis TaxID=2026190 RepID=UPI002E1D5B49|nr:family 78 glycoside hydrolase catalytic domain [Bacillus mobilis]MED0932858.1 family 78 glycoside hydrolase catalytic domain [Bacillus mobilis]MED0955617.1 family 78 glycoside hydrolase catalytic domain [Bacillus mobilis]
MLTIKKVLCESKKNPIGIDSKFVKISWQLESSNRNVNQLAYQLQVAKDKEFVNILFDSQKVETNQSLHIPIDSFPYKAETRYFYRVKVWDNHEEESSWSKVAFWETGLKGQHNWSGDWIAAKKERTQVMSFHKSFSIKKSVEKARLYITSLGVYEASINKERIGDYYFTPGWTSYDKRVLYQTYDITDLLKDEHNTISVLIGNGWYKGPLTMHHVRNYYGERRTIIAQIHITYEDGTKEKIVTDDTWKVTSSPILYSEIYEGEVYDARLEESGQELEDVEVIEHSKQIIVAQENESIRKMKIIKPISISKLPNHEWLIDMGQNMVGWVRFTVRHVYMGQKIELHHAEILNEDGSFYTGNLRKAKQKIVYIAKGEEGETFEPHFTYQGFRYVKISGLTQPPQIADYEGVVLHTDMEKVTELETSNPLINQLHHNVEWSQRGNFFDVPTDCPQRDDRLGWTGDAQMFIGTATQIMNVQSFFKKWLQDLSLDQNVNGAVPLVIPDAFGKRADFDLDTSGGWGDASIICPWVHYLHYGDVSILKEQYESMKKYIDYIRSQGENEYLWDTGYHLGDWLALDTKPDVFEGGTDKYFIATAFYAYSTSLLRRIAEILGENTDAKYYAELQGNIVQSFQNEFVTPNGRLISNTQTAHVLALLFELVNNNVKEKVFNRLIELLKENKNHLTTGFIGTPYLNLILSKFKRHDLACKLLLHEDYPSWLYQVKKGATTIWEHWDGVKEDGTLWNDSMNSYNHYAYGSIVEWIYRYIIGLEVDETKPAYKHFYIQPHFDSNLEWIKVKRETAYGEIKIEWRVEKEQAFLQTSVPPNTRATLRIDETIWQAEHDIERDLESGDYKFTFCKNIKG